MNLPPRICYLEFGYAFNQSVTFSPLLPLTHLSFGYQFNQPLTPLPSSLTHLTFGHSFNHPINPLPPNLKYLECGQRFNQPFTAFPLSLKYLKLRGKVKIECDIPDEILVEYLLPDKNLFKRDIL